MVAFESNGKGICVSPFASSTGSTSSQRETAIEDHTTLSLLRQAAEVPTTNTNKA